MHVKQDAKVADLILGLRNAARRRAGKHTRTATQLRQKVSASNVFGRTSGSSV